MNSAVIVAGGNGTRMNMKESKQFIRLDGVPVIIRTLRAFSEVPEIDNIVVVTRKSDISEVTRLIDEFDVKKVTSIVEGGETRQKSVLHGIEAVFDSAGGDTGNILIHDGARPFVSRACISGVLDALKTCSAAAAGVSVKDTIKQINSDCFIEKTVDRDNLISIQTPQGFDGELIYSVHKKAAESGIFATDDCALVESLTDIKVKVTEGDYNNIKITTPEDIPLGESILKKTRINTEDEMSVLNNTNNTQSKNSLPMFRTGIGYDVHILTENRKLILGGTEIPHDKGLLGHSDADVLVHAIMDALLGAAALGDIGKHFPDTDPKYKGADSIKLLRHVGRLLSENGCTVINIDSIIVAQEPKIAPYIESMRKTISEALGLDINRISVKATTTEKLGFEGRKEGISAHAVTSVQCEHIN